MLSDPKTSNTYLDLSLFGLIRATKVKKFKVTVFEILIF